MNTKLLHNSFNAGEISPELFSRPDVQQFRFGAARARNWFTKPAGGAQIRPGFTLQSTLASKGRAVPFRVDGDDFIITVEPGRFRFWRRGLPVTVQGGLDDVFIIGDQATSQNIDLVNDVVYTTRPHDFVHGDKVRLVSTSGTPPGGTATAFQYVAVPEGPRGVGLRFENVGPNAWDVISTTSITDSSEAWTPGAFVGRTVYIYDLDGNYVTHSEITANTATTLTFDAVASVPATGTYTVAVDVDMTSLNTGTLFIWHDEDGLPEDYQQPIPLASIPPADAVINRYSIGGNWTRVTLSGPHGWPVGTRFVWVGAGTPPNTRDYPIHVGVPYDGREFYTSTADAPYTLTASQLAAEQPNPYSSGGTATGWSICEIVGGAFVAPISAARIYPTGTVLFLRTATGDFTLGDFIIATRDIPASASGPLIADGWALTTSPWLELPNSYTEAELFELTFAQTEGRIRFAHKNHDLLELERLSSGSWTYSTPLTSDAADMAPSATAEFGAQIGISTTNPAGNLIVTKADHGLSPGDLIYVRNNASLTAGFYVVGAASGVNITQLMTFNGNTATPTGTTANGTIVVIDSTAQSNHRYIVTAVDSNGREFARSEPTVSIFNLLNNAEAYNSISWTPITNAAGYRIYKEQDGTELFGFIAETGTSPFLDRNIEPDFETLAPDIDGELQVDPPAAVAFYDQRGVFGGNTAKPQGLWLSSLGRDDDLITRRTQLDTDRIALEIASREGQSIRHVVPVSELLVLTDTTEWALTTKNTDTLTPKSATIRLQTTVGSSFVRPLVMNNSVLFCSTGSHIHRLGFQLTENSFGGTDLSTRAAHLFDDIDLVDSTQQTARVPIGWFTTSAGLLLGLTYSEEEQVAGWHQHTLAQGAKFISVASAREGSRDRLYAVVQDSAGAYTFQRMEPIDIKTIMGSAHLDRAKNIDQTAESAFNITLQGVNRVGAGVRVTATGAAFDPNIVGEELFLPDTDFRAKVVTRVSSSEVVCEVTDIGGGWPTPNPTWGITVSRLRNLAYAEGEIDAVLERADGTFTVTTLTVQANGYADLPFPCRRVHIGYTYDNELRTMPIAAQMEAAAQGRLKNVDHAYVRTFEAAGLAVGPDVDNLTVLHTDIALRTEVKRELIDTQWRDDGQIAFKQTKPLPATVVGVTLDVSFA